MALEATGTSNEAPGRSDRFVVLTLIDRLSDLTGGLSALGLLAMAGITCFDVFSRYLFNDPTYWATEIATYILVGMTFMALAAAEASGSHIRVELLLGLLGAAARRQVDLIAAWIGLFVVLFAGWQMVAFDRQEYLNDTRDWACSRPRSGCRSCRSRSATSPSHSRSWRPSTACGRRPARSRAGACRRSP